MEDIEVRKVREDEEGYAFEVRVGGAGDVTTHQVTLSRTDYERLGTGSGSPDTFVFECFRFLLYREPKESILRRFDVRDIGRYFPEFEREVGRPQKAR